MGHITGIVERWLMKVNRRSDLFGFADLIAVHRVEPGVLLAQVTTLSNLFRRLKKAKGKMELAVWAPRRPALKVHSWRSRDGRWQVKHVSVCGDDLQAVVLKAPGTAPRSATGFVRSSRRNGGRFIYQARGRRELVEMTTSALPDALPDACCTATKADGSPCRAKPLPGKDRCVFHDEASAAKRAEGRQRGGRERSRPRAVLPADAEDLPFDDAGAVKNLLGKTINDVRLGRIDPKIANAVGCLANVLLRAVEGGELSQLLDDMQRQIAEIKTRGIRNAQDQSSEDGGGTGGADESRDPTLTRLRRDPSRILVEAGMTPDPWQMEILRSPALRTLLLCSRQAGKSTVAAALALRAALLQPPALVLLLSPTQRQSGELFRDKVLRLYSAIGRPVPTTQESASTMTLANGSRIISLPGDEETIRGYSGVTLLVVDEASRVSDAS